MFEVSGVNVGGIPCTNWDTAATELEKQLMGALDRATGQIAVELKLMLTGVADDMRQQHSGAWPLSANMFGTAYDRLARRSGRGLKSIEQSISVTASSQGKTLVEGSISAADLSVHETGVTVTAKRKQYMAIPLRDALDSQGMPLKRNPRDWPNTFVHESKKGTLFIFQRRGRKIVPLYLLKRSVTIKPRLGMSEAFDKRIGYFENKALLALEREFGA